MFTFTPLLGAQSTSPASQSLLELDGGVKLLVDVGWDAAFDPQQLLALQEHVPTLSLVLLTHPTIDHLGAFAHCCKHIPLFARLPVYATTPVINLGRTLLTDVYASGPTAASFIPTSASPAVPLHLLLPPPTSEEIASYFTLIHPLKYSQPHQPIPPSFSPSLGGLTITAYAAGHTLGGTIWHLQHGLESIVYAADWNQGRENLLSGASWLSSAAGGAEIIEPLRRPTALLCSSKGAENSHPLPRKTRDDTLISLVRDAIAQGGKVLIPTDSSARVLELALLLNSTWRENIDGPHADTYKNARIYMASTSCSASMRYLQSMLEWVDESVRSEAEASMSKARGQATLANPLEWNFIRHIDRRSQLDRALARSRPCILLASDASLGWGFSRQALQSLAADSKNLVVLTEAIYGFQKVEKSLSGQLWDLLQHQGNHTSVQSGDKVVNPEGVIVDFQVASTTSLNADEMALHQTYLARQRQLHSTLQGDHSIQDATTTELADDQASESSESDDEDDDTEHQGRAMNLSAQLTQSNKRKAVGITETELGVSVLLRGKNVHDYEVRGKRGREKIFPFVAHRTRNDDFGDLIKPEEYLRAEERDDVSGLDMGATEPDGGVAAGQKRKWGDDSAASKLKKRAEAHKSNKKQKQEHHEPDNIDALIARATGEPLPGQGPIPNGVNEEQEAEDEDEDGEESESDYEPEEALPASPQKVVLTERRLELRCRISYVDFAGLHEKRDLQMLIPLIQPRKLILIAGEQRETQMLAEECRRLLTAGGGKTDVFAPVVGETVDASVDTNAWTLKLSRQLVKKLTWQNVKGLGIVALTGRLDVEPTEEAADVEAERNEQAKKKLKLAKVERAGDVDSKALANTSFTVPVLDLLTAQSTASAAQQRVTQPVHVGDLRLAALRQLLQASGHTADFRGEGTLLVDGSVVVRKGQSGKIEVDAGAGGLAMPQYRTRDTEGSFYAVRKAVYSGLAVVTGV